MEFDLVFEGGGAKGMVFAGALKSFEGAGHQPGRLLGTSAGAITAALMAAGYDAPRMLESLKEQTPDGRSVFEGFMGTPGPFTSDFVDQSSSAGLIEDINIPVLWGGAEERVKDWFLKKFSTHPKWSHLFAMVELGGWFTADQFVDWMRKKLDDGRVDGAPMKCGDMTLSEFFAATKRELTVVASDTTGQQVLVLNHRTAPELPVVWAVRMSMSIPLVWPEVEWRGEWGAYRGQDVTGHLVVDGGMLSNFPLELFVSDAPHIVEIMGESSTGDIIGLLIDEALVVPDAPPAPDPEKQGFAWGELKTARRVMRLVDTMTKAHDKSVMEVLEDLVIRLPAQGYGTTEFGMDEDRRNALVTAGARVMGDYLKALEEGGKERDLDGYAEVQRVSTRVAAGILPPTAP